MSPRVTPNLHPNPNSVWNLSLGIRMGLESGTRATRYSRLPTRMEVGTSSHLPDFLVGTGTLFLDLSPLLPSKISVFIDNESTEPRTDVWTGPVSLPKSWTVPGPVFGVFHLGLHTRVVGGTTPENSDSPTPTPGATRERVVPTYTVSPCLPSRDSPFTLLSSLVTE